MRSLGVALLTIAVTAGACLAGGCGGSDGSEPSRNAEADAFAERVVRAIRKPDCAELRRINYAAQRVNSGYVAIPCPKRRRAKRVLRGFEIVGSAAYGTAAVVDYRSERDPKGASMLLVRNSVGDWVVSVLSIPLAKPVVGTPDTDDRRGYDEAAHGYVRAVRTNNCRKFYEHAATPKAPSRSVACFVGFQGISALRQGLAHDRGSKPEYAGGNSSFGFYGLTTGKPPVYRTLVVGESRAKGSKRIYYVLNVSDGPPS